MATPVACRASSVRRACALVFVAWPFVAVRAAVLGPWQCQRYEGDQDDEWCKSAGTVDGQEYHFFGMDSWICGECWCCKRKVGPSTTLTSTTETTTTATTTSETSTTKTTTSSVSTTLTSTSTISVTSSTSSETSSSTTATATTTSTETLTETSSTVTTRTTTASSTSTSTVTKHALMYGTNATEDAFKGWLSIWRSKYRKGLWKAGLSDPWESLMPDALKGVSPEILKSEGGVASDVVTEGMGYGIMLEGILSHGGDDYALQQGLSLMKSWLAMVTGPAELARPFAGGSNFSGSSSQGATWPYGVSAVKSQGGSLGVTGVPAWKFPIDEDKIDDFQGSAADGDQDAILGMVYLAATLKYPDDFVDVVMRSVIAFASADLGFPDLYRILPNGEKIYVPKLGSMWGGLLPPHGKYKTKQEPWCYSPGYFAPAHYRSFRDFARTHWRPDFNGYLPTYLNGSASTLQELLDAFDSAVTAGYNILYYSSCKSGSVANWVGVEAACDKSDTLGCSGVPWQHTPWVGAHHGTCNQSGTKFGAFGADASRAAWRLAMDYILYREESAQVTMYDRNGEPEPGRVFGARVYLNRIVAQYKNHATCDGGMQGSCMNTSDNSPFELAYAFDPKKGAPDLKCPQVPNDPESWWAGFMSYPTFSAFVAPHDEIGEAESKQWMDTFSSICDFSAVNTYNYFEGHPPKGQICLTSYFEASQAIIVTTLMSGRLGRIAGLPRRPLSAWQAPARANATAQQEREHALSHREKSALRYRKSNASKEQFAFKADVSHRGASARHVRWAGFDNLPSVEVLAVAGVLFALVAAVVRGRNLAQVLAWDVHERTNLLAAETGSAAVLPTVGE